MNFLFILTGLIYNNSSTVPHHDENELGFGYLNLIALNNGISIDLKLNDYSSGLASLGQLTWSKLILKTDFLLTHTPVDTSTISVKVDSVSNPFIFNLDSVQLDVSNAGSENSEVKINYCMEATPLHTF